MKHFVSCLETLRSAPVKHFVSRYETLCFAGMKQCVSGQESEDETLLPDVSLCVFVEYGIFSDAVPEKCFPDVLLLSRFHIGLVAVDAVVFGSSEVAQAKRTLRAGLKWGQASGEGGMAFGLTAVRKVRLPSSCWAASWRRHSAAFGHCVLKQRG